jgi:hypothetical protein
MSTSVSLRLPPTSAEKLGLEPAPAGIYRLSWIELAFRLAKATGRAEFAEVDAIQRELESAWYARAAAYMVLTRTDWRLIAWETGLLALLDSPDELDRDTAAGYLECLFTVLVAQPTRFQDFEARLIRPEHVMGWAFTLSREELSTLAASEDERRSQAEPEGIRPTITSSAIYLYLRMTGQLPSPEPEHVSEPEPLVIPFPEPGELVTENE